MPTGTEAQCHKRAQELAKIQTQEVQLELHTKARRKANDDEHSAARIAKANKELEVKKQLQTAAGDKDAAAETGLHMEQNAY